MHKYTEQFVNFCEKNLDLEKIEDYHYHSLSICIIDCIYSLRVKYESVTKPLIKKYANLYLNGDINGSGDTVSMLLQHIDENGGPAKFADVIGDHHKLGGKSAIPKENVCHQLALYLKYLHIETIEDFRNFESPELLEVVIRAVKGIGDAGANYLFMLAGDPNRCKPDVHIHQCIKESCGGDISNEECQTLLSETVHCLNKRYPNLTVCRLDGIIWRKYQSK